MTKFKIDNLLKLLYGIIVALMGFVAFVIMMYSFYHSQYASAAVSSLFIVIFTSVGWRPIIKYLFPTLKQK